MSSKQCDEAESTVTNMAANNSGEEDDLGVLIYRESQLRKAEAAIAAESKKKTHLLQLIIELQLGRRDRL